MLYILSLRRKLSETASCNQIRNKCGQPLEPVFGTELGQYCDLCHLSVKPEVTPGGFKIKANSFSSLSAMLL